MITELQAQLQKALGSGYTLERELGGGGMSRVFVAHETSLGRKVVVKVLPPELAASVNAERFRREIQLSAQLQHPHIVPLLATGIADGLPYYTMPLVEGESLRARLNRGGELSIHDATRILREVTDALAYAHGRGVVHRDIKPDNVLISGSHVMVTDFGVAKALSASTAEGGTLTSIGISLGTPSYMAPEQAAADPATDHRADIYSLGILAYEMLTGRTPFAGLTPQAMLAAHVTEAPVPITTRRPMVPPALADLIMRCLCKHASDRPQTADEVLREIEALATPSGGTAPTGARIPAAPEGFAGQSRVGAVRILSLYAAALLVVVIAARIATTTIGLPDWVLPGAIVVMALGLPVIALTFLVHRIPPTANTAGRVAAVARPWLTWRRATLGGVIAMAVFVMLVGGYMLGRRLGIGPGATLFGTGELAERDRILVADFASSANDTLLGSVITEALRADLGQSRVLRVVQPSEMRGVLQRMQRTATRIDPALAREIAEREGIKAVVEGDVTPLAGGYVIVARLVSPGSGEVLGSFRQVAGDSRELIATIDRISRDMREKTGESLKRIRATPALSSVTTTSLDALRKYTLAIQALDREGDYPKGIAMLEEAVALDSTFAMAYRKLSAALSNMGDSRSAAMATRAFRYRDHLTDIERYLTAGAFYSNQRNFDPEKAISAYESALEIDPASSNALTNLSRVYLAEHVPERATVYLRRAYALDSSSIYSLWNLAMAELNRGDTAAAGRLVRRAASVLADLPTGESMVGEFDIARFRFDSAEARFRRLIASRPNDQLVRTLAVADLSGLAVTRGQLRESERMLRQVEESRRGSGDQAASLATALTSALSAVYLRNDEAGALRLAEHALAAVPLRTIDAADWPIESLASLYGATGRVDLLRQLISSAATSLAPESRRGAAPRLAFAQANLALLEKRYVDAADMLRDVKLPWCPTCTLPWLAQAYDAAGIPDSAIAIYERYLTTPDFERRRIDPIRLAPAQKRVAELYEARGDTVNALRHYEAFVDLWKRADPELQPVVTEVRRRIGVLRRQRG